MITVFTQKMLKGAIAILVCFAAASVNAQCIYFKKLASGPTSTHCLGIKTDGTLWAWGSNSNGELGIGSQNSSAEPVQVGDANNWKEISTGNHHSLAIDNNGKLWAWGNDVEGELGDGQPIGNPLNVLTPKHITSPDSIWIAIAASSTHSAGITADGRLWVWGYATFYNAGGTIPNTPKQVGTDTDWAAITAGSLHFVAIKKDSTLWAWGRNGEGEAGDSTTKDNIYTPPVEIDSNHVWVYVSAGANHTLALKNDGTLCAWGDNENGKLGDGSTTLAIYKPEQIGTQKWLTVSAGLDYSLGIDLKGRRWAWGDNGLGEFGNDSSTNKDTYSPELVDSSNNWVNVIAARDFSLNLSKDGSAWSSGDNDFEELGDGTNTRRFTLIKVGTPVIYPALANSGGSDKEYQRGFSYYATNCNNLITEIFKSGANPIHANTTAKVWIDDTVMNDGTGKPYVQRHYEIHPANNDTNATGTVILYFTQDEFTSYNASLNVMNGTYPMLPVDATDATGYRNNLKIDRIIAASNDGSGKLNTYKGTSTLITPTSVQWLNGRWQATFTVTGFGGFFATTGATLLPVTWLNVNAALNNQKQVQINWKVQEESILSYNVEKSSDGKLFISLANIPSKGNGQNSYQYTDTKTKTGNTFYRIKQIDKDGKNTYSTIISLSMVSNVAVLSLFPNPVYDNVYLNGLSNEKMYHVVITDMSGRIIAVKNINGNNNRISVASFAKGVYLLKISSDDLFATLKFIKQ